MTVPTTSPLPAMPDPPRQGRGLPPVIHVAGVSLRYGRKTLALDNVSLLPHVASASVATRNAMADLVADNLISWFEQGRPLTPVPETPFKR